LAILLLVFLQAFTRLSVYPPATRQAAWMLLVVGGFFLLLHNQLSSEAKLEAFVSVLLLFGFALAVFSIVQKLSFNGKVYWFWTPHQAGEIFGPFIKRNDYAAWALMLVPLAWIKAGRRRQAREVQIFWGLVVLVLGISILYSLSRAGSLLFLLFFPLYALLGRRPERSGRAALVVALGVILVAAIATVGLDTGRLLTRWESLGNVQPLGVGGALSLADVARHSADDSRPPLAGQRDGDLHRAVGFLSDFRQPVALEPRPQRILGMAGGDRPGGRRAGGVVPADAGAHGGGENALDPGEPHPSTGRRRGARLPAGAAA
jgi:hypothetical protein